MKPKLILITGVTGTLGQALLSKILSETEHYVVGISRDEQKQRLLPKHDRARYRLADVRDIDSLSKAVGRHKVDNVFHLAALKCVDTLEENRLESIKTNVWGTNNVCDLFDQSRILLASTDKACYPINTYGMTKSLAEKIVTEDPKNVVVRYGNVLGSRGSILPGLIKSLKENNRAHITDDKMTRFWMPIDTVRDFVYETGMSDVLTGLVTPKDIRASYVTDLIKAVAKILRVYKYDIADIGIRPGEKFFETLVNEYETEHKKAINSSDNALLMTHKELMDMLKPIINGMEK